MHPLPLLTTLTALLVTALAAPAPTPHRLVARDGPCDAFSEACRPVINANACFAAYVMLGEREQMLQCVDHEDAARAEELVSAGPLQGRGRVLTRRLLLAVPVLWLLGDDGAGVGHGDFGVCGGGLRAVGIWVGWA
jgi:hypothetical protein